jgi:GTP cyclohydrolase I
MPSYAKDHTLGLNIKAELEARGIETPTVPEALAADSELKIQELTELFHRVWTTLGLDLDDDSLSGTPLRMAKMYVDEIYSGLDYNNFPKCTTVENKMGYDEVSDKR